MSDFPPYIIIIGKDQVGLAKDSTLSSELTRKIKREGSITHINVNLSAAGSQDVYTPSTGKKAKVLGFFLKCDSDVNWELRFKTSGNFIAGLPVKGAVAMNGVGMEMPIGGTDETIEVYADGACTIKGWICILET